MPKDQKKPPLKLVNNHKPWYDIKAAADNTAEIFIYEEIGDFWGMGVGAQRFITDLKALGAIKKINLRINSPGGDVFDGIAIFNALQNHGAKITVQVDGIAASIASIIALAGDTLVMSEGSFLMIHKAWLVTYGNADDLKQKIDVLDKIDGTLASIYEKRSGYTGEEIQQLMTDETWFTAEEAVAAGFADRVSAGLKVAASISPDIMARFKHLPEGMVAVAINEEQPANDEIDYSFQAEANERELKLLTLA